MINSTKFKTLIKEKLIDVNARIECHDGDTQFFYEGVEKGLETALDIAKRCKINVLHTTEGEQE